MVKEGGLTASIEIKYTRSRESKHLHGWQFVDVGEIDGVVDWMAVFKPQHRGRDPERCEWEEYGKGSAEKLKDLHLPRSRVPRKTPLEIRSVRAPQRSYENFGMDRQNNSGDGYVKCLCLRDRWKGGMALPKRSGWSQQQQQRASRENQPTYDQCLDGCDSNCMRGPAVQKKAFGYPNGRLCSLWRHDLGMVSEGCCRQGASHKPWEMNRP